MGTEPVAIVWPCQQDVDTYATAGRAVQVPRPGCPACARSMSFWSGYERYLRTGSIARKIWIRRARCAGCETTHALIPHFVLLRRLDHVEVIGSVLAEVVGRGRGVRPAAEEAGVPHTTARDWCRRFRFRAVLLAAGFAALAVELGGGAPPALAAAGTTALVAIAAAWRAAQSRFGSFVRSPWPFAGLVIGGSLLHTTTDPPWAWPTGRRFIAPVPETAS